MNEHEHKCPLAERCCYKEMRITNAEQWCICGKKELHSTPNQCYKEKEVEEEKNVCPVCHIPYWKESYPHNHKEEAKECNPHVFDNNQINPECLKCSSPKKEEVELPETLVEAIHAEGIAGVLPHIEEDRRAINKILKHLKSKV